MIANWRFPCNVFPVVATPMTSKSQACALAESVAPTNAPRQLDILAKTLANWLGAFRGCQPLSSPGRKPVSEMESELARLRTENAAAREPEKSDGILRQRV